MSRSPFRLDMRNRLTGYASWFRRKHARYFDTGTKKKKTDDDGHSVVAKCSWWQRLQAYVKELDCDARGGGGYWFGCTHEIKAINLPV